MKRKNTVSILTALLLSLGLASALVAAPPAAWGKCKSCHENKDQKKGPYTGNGLLTVAPAQLESYMDNLEKAFNKDRYKGKIPPAITKDYQKGNELMAKRWKAMNAADKKAVLDYLRSLK